MNYKSIAECYPSNPSLPLSNLFKESQTEKSLVIEKTRSNYNNTANPLVWGPALWLFLHISSVNYDINPSKDTIEKCKQFIIALPYMLPCLNCSEHAKAYIQANKNKLNVICSNRDNLFKFYVDFHNYVNTRHNKREFTYREAWDMYGKGVDILNFNY